MSIPCKYSFHISPTHKKQLNTIPVFVQLQLWRRLYVKK